MDLEDYTYIPLKTQDNIDELARNLCFYSTGGWGDEIVFLHGVDLHPQRLGPTGSLKGPRWKCYQHKAACQIVAFAVLTEAMMRKGRS
jgi:hypothetical protein